jgi:hypothetical protein
MAVRKTISAQYYQDVHASHTSAVDGEPEAQLTAPFAALVRAVAQDADLEDLTLIRETRHGRIRPDFGVLARQGTINRFAGWIELKAPAVDVDANTWTGRNAEQWTHLRQLDVLIIANGRNARLYRDGEAHGADAALPYDSPTDWSEAPLLALLNRFLEARPRPITSVRDLARRLALRTADLRDRILWLLEAKTAAGNAAQQAFASWRALVHPECSPRDFADGSSQVVAYGMALAVLSTDGADKNHDGVVSVAEARTAIRQISPVMAAAFGPLVDKLTLNDAVKMELGALEVLASAIDPKRVNHSADPRGEPWLYFFEDFLSVYDPVERKQAGVYFTPTEVVRGMAAMVEDVLVRRFRKRLGFADAHVVTLDPATGTGTFPLAVIDRAAASAEKLRGVAGDAFAAKSLWQNLIAFELLPGPYSVAHLRIAQRLRELDPEHAGTAQVILTDTLESPLGESQFALFGDADVLAQEQNRAKRVKAERQVTVILGNPPYRRVEREISGRGSGGWVVEGKVPGRKTEKSLFADILDVAKKETIFSHQASLYNLYVYFWRWALWKAMEAHGAGPRVVSFITANSWLTGPGFVGLRQLIRELSDEMWIIDLGGDGQGTTPEQNIFAIETPVAIVMLVRDNATDRSVPARAHYRKIGGTAKEKLSAMRQIAFASDPFEGDWQDLAQDFMAPLVPPTGNSSWLNMPALTNLFPWQQPGCMYGRTWPIAPDSDLLQERWRIFTAAPAAEKPGLFATAKTGRTVATSVSGLTPLANLKVGAKPMGIIPYGFRSFDRQWTFDDPRLAALERPALRRSMSHKQLFLASLLTGKVSTGPSITVTPYIPDKHYFRGSFGGKDIIPLYRDSAARSPNVTKGLLKRIGDLLGVSAPTPEDLAAYVYALLSTPHYQQNFEEALKTPGPRVPITRDPALWHKAVGIGKRLLWLHTFGDRMRDENHERGEYIPDVPGVGWTKAISVIPRSTRDIRYSAETGLLTVGDGEVTGVRPEVWGYSVSGMQIVRKWLAYRTAGGAGRAATSANALDRVRPQQWVDEWNDELLDLLRILTLTVQLNEDQAALLDQVCAGELISDSELPVPKKTERTAPGKSR